MAGASAKTVALLALCGVACGSEPPAPRACEVNGPSPAIAIDRGLALWNTAQAVVVDSRIWIAHTYSVDERTGASEVRLSSVTCETSAVESRGALNTEPAAGRDVLLTALGQQLLVGWNSLTSSRSPPRLRSYATDRLEPGQESSLVLQGATSAQAQLRLTNALPLAGGGFVLSGTSDSADGTCPQPFLQKLDAAGAPIGGFLDIAAGGLGRCARGLAPVLQAGDGRLFFSWASSRLDSATGAKASLNDLMLDGHLLGGSSTTVEQVPSSAGVDPTGISGLAAVSAVNAKLTEGSRLAQASGAWQPHFVAFVNRPPASPSRILLRDVAMPEGTPGAKNIEVQEGAVEKPRLLATPNGGLLAWTIVPTDPAEPPRIVAQRFAYNGDQWKVGERLPFAHSGPNIRLQSITAIRDDLFFVVWTEGNAGAIELKGAVVEW